MNRILECVPNFSEGRDMKIIDQICDEIRKVEGVQLLDVDPGKATNRTVVTFVGEPEKVAEAAFLAVKAASHLIDMSGHKGEHPRFGATDVCPLVPVSGISMEETVELARNLGKRIGEELGIPVFCYENAAFSEERRNLASVRSGEYEGLPEKLSKPEWKPDFGPARFNPKSGAIAVGARDFLVAYNINLNTTSTRRANAIAFDIREKGRVKREGNPVTGPVVKDDKGNPVYTPGSLKAVKAIGWFIEEYGIAQISINLTNISITSIHQAFDEACRKAEERGVRVTGSELVGLVPLKALLEAGRHYLHKQQRSSGVSDRELIKIAVKSLGLNELYPFKPEEKIIEYRMKAGDKSRSLINLSVEDFVHETASESPAPGGGSVSACIGAMGVALGTMVANLSSHKRGWDERWKEFSELADEGKALQESLLKKVDEDTEAFNRLMDAFQMAKKTPEEKSRREMAIQKATKNAMLVPLSVMEESLKAFGLLRSMVEKGNPNSLSDAAVGIMALRTAISGAYLNVRINAPGLKAEKEKEALLSAGQAIYNEALEIERQIMILVDQKLNQMDQ